MECTPLFLICQLEQLPILSLEDARVKEGAFFLGSEYSSHRLLNLWLLQLLVPTVNSWSGSCSEHLVWFLQWTSGGWRHTAANRKKKKKPFQLRPLVASECSAAVRLSLGSFIVHSGLWHLLVDGFPWKSRGQFPANFTGQISHPESRSHLHSNKIWISVLGRGRCSLHLVLYLSPPGDGCFLYLLLQNSLEFFLLLIANALLLQSAFIVNDSLR